jgi:hypothetical protein
MGRSLGNNAFELLGPAIVPGFLFANDDREQAYAGVGGGDGSFYGSGEGQNYAGRFGMRVAW